MSKLDKEKVLADYTAAYKKAHGKAPSIEAKSGWYSVNGGKNVRLAQLAEEAESLAEGAGTPAKKESKPKAAVSKSAPQKATVKSSSKGGLTAKELWQQKLQQKSGRCRFPRGS